MDFVMEGFAKTTLFIQEVINKKRELISEFSLSLEVPSDPD
jgi:hypothetical protein